MLQIDSNILEPGAHRQWYHKQNMYSSDILWTSYFRYVNSTWHHAQKQRIANGAAFDTVAFGHGAK